MKKNVYQIGRKNVYTIKRIDEKLGQNYYYIEGFDRSYLRFELLKV